MSIFVSIIQVLYVSSVSVSPVNEIALEKIISLSAVHQNQCKRKIVGGGGGGVETTSFISGRTRVLLF